MHKPALLIISLATTAWISLSASAEEATFCESSAGGLVNHGKCVKVTEDEAVAVDSYGRRLAIRGMARVKGNEYCKQSGGHINHNQCWRVRDGKLFPIDMYGRETSMYGTDIENKYRQVD